MSESSYGGAGPLILAIIWLEFSIALILAGLRFYVGVWVRRPLGWDFFWMIFAMVFGLAAQCLITDGVYEGLGNHFDVLSPSALEQAGKMSLISITVILIGTPAGKIAVTAFILRVQGETHASRRIFLHFIAYSNIILCAIQAVMNMVQCTPTEKFYNPTVPGNCDRSQVTAILGYVQGGWCGLSDLLLAIYPALLFKDLTMELRLKIGLSVLMGAGVVAAACAFVKTWEIHAITQASDRTYDLYPLLLWTYTEYWLVLITGSLPPLRPLIMTAARGAVSYVSSASKGATGNKSIENGYASRRSWQLKPMAHVHLESTESSERINSNQWSNEDELIMKRDVTVITERRTADEEAGDHSWLE